MGPQGRVEGVQRAGGMADRPLGSVGSRRMRTLGTHAFRAGRSLPLALGAALGTLLAVAAAAQPEATAVPPPEPALAQGAPDPAAPFVPAPIPESRPSLVEQAWRAPAPDLATRVIQTRRAALEFGAWNLDPAARVLGSGRTVSLEQATAAVELAPDLPAARMRLARALWLQGGSPIAAIRAALGGLRAIPRHPEASLWFAGSLLWLLAVALVAGGLGAIALAGLVALPHAAHDLSHALPGRPPTFAGFAALAALLLLPLAFGEGILGLGLALLIVAAAYGGRLQRVAMALAIACVGLGAYPLAQLANAALAVLPEDPVATSAYSVSHGLATPVDVARLEAAADHDPLAARGLAIHARRSGNLGEADALYQKLLQTDSDDPAVLNNAANVRLDLGHMERALDLYHQAVDLEETPELLFNLAQAYGRAFQVEELNRTLARAQDLGGDFVGELTALQGTEAEGFVVDFPLPVSLLWARALRRHSATPVAAELRAALAPGRLGSDARVFAAAGAAVAALGALLGSLLERSRWCPRCGNRICPRCTPAGTGRELCQACHRLFFQPEKTDRALRLERVNELRRREQRMNRLAALVSVLVPGAAGLVADKPLRSLVGAVCFALAGTAFFWRAGVVPDPLVAGATAPFAFLGLAGFAGLAYVIVVAASLRARSES